MSIEEIIHELELEGSAYEEMIAGTTVADRVKERWARRVTAMREAIALLKTHPEALPNDPLTLVVPVEEMAKRDQEIKGIQAEVDRLNKENFWLTSEREMEPAWIAMADKLPEEDGSYIVCTKLGAVCTATFNVKLGRWGHSLYGVTHWMPLPKRPD